MPLALLIVSEHEGNFRCTRGLREDIVIECKDESIGLRLLKDLTYGAIYVNRLSGKCNSANMDRLKHEFYLYSINAS